MRAYAAFALLLGALLAAPASAIDAGDNAPIIEAPKRDGEALSLRELRGRVVYIDFWASWCAPCRAAMPELDALQERLADDGLTVLGVNVDRNRAAALRMLEEIPVGFPIVFDPEGEWARRYALPGMPTGFLIDREGVVRYRHSGYRAADLPELTRRIEALLEPS